MPPDTAGAPAAPPQPHHLGRRAARGLVWSALAFGGNRLLIFAGTLVLARILTPHDFGVVTAAMTLILYVEIGLDLGVGAAVVYEQERGISPRVETAFTLNVLVAALLTAVAVVAAPAVAAFFRIPDEAALFRLLAAYLLLRGLAQVPESMLRRDLRFARRAAVDLVRAAVRVAVSVALAVGGLGAMAIVWGLLAGEAAGAVAAWRLAAFRPRLRLQRSAARQLLGFGGAAVAVKVVDAISLDGDYLVVGRMLGATQLGYYTIAYRLPELVLLNLYWVFSGVAFPVYSQARTAGRNVFSAAMLRALRLLTLYGFPAGIGLALVSRDAVLVLFSDRWASAIAPMALLSLAAALAAVGFASGDIFPALGRPGTLLRLNIGFTVVLLAAFVIVAPHGITAIAAVHLVAQSAYAVVRLAVANRLVGSTMRQSIAAMRHELAASAGIVAAALPVGLVTEAGAGSLLVIIGLGVAGGVAGVLLVDRSAVRELRSLVGSIRGEN